MENLYEILEVSKNASPEVIDKAYKTLAKKYHPDVSENKEKAEKMMKKLNSAYEILSNPKTREEYDYNLEQDEKVNNTIKQEVENKVSYNEYYNIQNEQEADNNIYNNYYQQESDYANNLNLFNRIRNLQLDKNKKIILLIIIFILVLLIFKLFSLIGDIFKIPGGTNINNNNIHSSNNENEEEYPINDTTPVNLVNKLFEDLKLYNIEEINKNLTDNTKFSTIGINTLKEDKEIYQYIIENSEYMIKDSEVTNKKAIIKVEINSFNVESAILEYEKWVRENYQDLIFEIGYVENKSEIINKEKLVEKALECLKSKINEKEVREIEIIVDNTEKGWKINFNTYNILGTRIL